MLCSRACHCAVPPAKGVRFSFSGLPSHLFHTDFAPLNNFLRWLEGTDKVRVSLHSCPLTVECNFVDYMKKSMQAQTIIVFTHFFRVKYADRAVHHILATSNATGRVCGLTTDRGVFHEGGLFAAVSSAMSVVRPAVVDERERECVCVCWKWGSKMLQGKGGFEGGGGRECEWPP